MKSVTLSHNTRINKPIAEVFEFFSKAENLNLLTPPIINFKILSPLPIKMFPGQIINYQIALMGIPFKWKTKISVWNPPHSFVDEQISGPYSKWHHQHIFKSVGNETEMTDIVEYRSKGWIFAPFLHWLFVDKKVNEIFAYREQQLNEIFRNN
ncbi:MAG: SRPBCC family protein [Bacteroidia bacterium]|nr:SRPBCC family protein [Bacteroidia bacterium]MCF8425473.1 SRPBCC family protein [Bacteroidia bacterium]MCF8445889.1 SRPBCC family protein [Bacteroidia bacterium]